MRRPNKRASICAQLASYGTLACGVRQSAFAHGTDPRDLDLFVPIIADADAAQLIASDIARCNAPVMSGERTQEGSCIPRPGLRAVSPMPPMNI